MTRSRLSRRSLIALGGAALLAPGASLAQSSKRDVEGGIGGTGIVGVLTDFGSLIVGGNYVKTDGTTAFSDPFGSLSESDLAIGDSLTVEAAGPPGQLVARRVHVTYPLVGTVTEVSSDGRKLVVNSVDVLIGAAQRKVRVGQRLAISGLWDGNQVRASRLTAARSNQDLVSGDVSNGAGRVAIGPMPLGGSGFRGLANKSFATAIGQFDQSSGAMNVQDIQEGRFVGAAGALESLSIEGYLDPISERPGFRLSGLGHSFSRNVQLGNYASSRILLNGPYTGKFAPDRVVVLPDGFRAQRRVMKQISNRNR